METSSSPAPDGNFSTSFEARSASLRRLARSLLGNDAGADDVVQETWAVYLNRPPPASESTDGFLATLTRRLAWRSRRSDLRRREREQLAARAERTRGPDEIAERASALREVLELVTALREPYRRAIWQRYFDDLPPREIARASGESLATVKSRLQRGLEMLREELDRRHGGRRSDWTMALMPLGAAPAAAIGLGISGGLLMGTSFKLAAAAVVIACAVGVLLWSTESEHRTVASELLADAPKANASVAQDAGTPVGPAAEARSAVGDPSLAPEDPPLVIAPELEHPYLYVLAVRTVDENGMPVEGTQLKLAPPRSSMNLVGALSESEGWTTIAWRGKQPEMDVDLQTSGSSSLSGSRRLHLRAGTSTEVAVLGQGQTPQILHIQFASGELTSQQGADVARVIEARLVSSLALDGRGSDTLRMERFPHPHARFGDRFVRLSEPTPVAETTILEGMKTLERRMQLDGARLQLRSSFVFSGAEIRSDAPAATDVSRISVRVLDDRGEPVPNCLVALGHQLDKRDETTITDDKGDAVFDRVASGWWEARAGGGAGGLARERLFVTAPNPLHWEAHLDRGARIIGHVFDAEGKGLQDSIVRYESTPDAVARGTRVRVARETLGGEEIAEASDSALAPRNELRAPWIDSTTVREDGSFELANLPAGLGRLLVLAPGDGDGPALYVEEGVLPGEHDYAIRLGASTGSLHAQIQLPEPWQGEPVELRAISESTGRGVSFAQGEERYRCANLATGWYRVEVDAGVFGWHDLGRHYVEAGAEIDIGGFTPPAPGSVRVLLPESVPENLKEGPPELGLTFYLRRADLDIRGEPRTLKGSETLHMPAGEYWAFWTAFDGSVRHRALTLEPGAAVELDLREAR